ncbi:hypothetical protein V8C40DRAFT_280408 [Trichoderma camerunense]
MKTVYRRDAYSEQMHQRITDEWGRSYGQKATPGSNMILVDVQEGAEQKVGYSYTDPGNANFILALVSRLAASTPLYSVQSFMEHPEADPSIYAWGQILVITGYKQQKLLLEEKAFEAVPFNQATFANVPEVDYIFRPIFSSGKVEKGQTVKKVKHQRVQAKKESAANYHAKEARKLIQSFYSYDKPADANKSQDGSIPQIPLASICLGVMK